MPARFDLVIFDCDGVLVDTEAIDDEVISHLMAEIGVHIAPAEVNRLSRGLSSSDMWAVFEHEFACTIPESFAERWETLALAMFATKLESIPGVIEVLIALTKAEVPICVASSGSHKKLAVTLGTTGLELFFDGNIFSATQVARGKPAPDLFLFAAERMGTPPQRCVVIEDSYNGVQAGLAAGMTVLGFVPDEYGDDRIHTLGVQTFSVMPDLPALLGLEAAP